MQPNQTQGISLAGKSAEELNNLLAVAEAQLVVSQAQPSLLTANCKVAIDNANRNIATQQTNITNIQSAIAALATPAN